MEAIKDTLGVLLKQLKSHQKPLNERPETWLKKSLTKRELGHISGQAFKGGTLKISVDSASWLYHLNLQKRKLLKKISMFCPGVKDIRFVLGDAK